jgi:hypothetical protein
MVYQPFLHKGVWTMRQATLSRILAQALLASLSASIGCSVDVSSFDSPLCVGGYELAVDGLHPATPVDYIELRSVDELGSPSRVLSTTGSKCATAPMRVTCESTVDGTMPTAGFYRRCTDHCEGGALIATRGGAVIVVDSKAKLDALLAPYDTPQEALLAALTTGQWISCSDKKKGSVRAVADGYEVVTSTGSGCGTADPVRQHLLHVDASGVVEERSSYTLEAGTPGCVIGRRPEGLHAASAVRRRSGCVGRYFADTARLEQASVKAFLALMTELRWHRAPASLLRQARRAAQEEVRHTRVTRRLAKRYGATAKASSVRSLPVRSLLSLAIENVQEGCVRETFGVLVGRWQALRAADPAIRRAMWRIARDEGRHAALSWQVARWVQGRLSVDEQARVEQAKRQAIETLRAELQTEPQTPLVQLAGLPRADDALRLLAQLEVRLWTQPQPVR